MKKKITTINEDACAALGIDRDEYALCDYIQFRQADRRKRAGWCVDSKQEIADHVRISVRGLYKMLDRLHSNDLLFIAPDGAIQVTEKWLLAVNDRELSSRKTMNLVHADHELSSRKTMNLVHTHNKVKYEYKYEEVERERGATRAKSKKEKAEPIEAEQVVSPSRPAQRVPPAPPVPAAPPAPAYNPPDSDKEAEALLADEICRERFFKQCRIPLDKYDSYVRLFALKVKSEQKRHSNRTDYRSHFFNWATVEYAREQNQPGNGNRKMVFDSPDTIREGLEFAERFAAEYRARQNRT